MKAKSLVLILCIGLMCFTGFGSTTADLTKNSTDSSFVDSQDLELNVVNLTADHFVLRNDVISNKYLTSAEVAAKKTDLQFSFNLTQTNALKTFDKDSLKNSRDVGWQSLALGENRINILNYPMPENIPRDNIRNNIFLFFI
ncbi:hypothetical protein SAMN04487764_1512 [Gillisia sp. Hel1_33_143]|uniref:hypothetical protein n=1 Tax=Gillisia sp. Hel1_33_143 TaxID=1336796 RepID=UPI00087DDBDD|nr:hypothetical protein [Gillisia sp. Hel1_33_143]SDS12570.1 hypothetical protein SAMN04487764_1512 [Gillisia sp. Hel1_33_143]